MCPDNYKRKTKSCLCLSYVQDREMYKSARNPARQLNSKAIKDAASCFLSPIIRSRLSVVTATCVWRVQRKDLTEAWTLVCKKREECSRSLLTLEGLEFFFSALGVKEPLKKDKEKSNSEECNDDEDGDENEDSGVSESSQISQATERSFAIRRPRRNGFPRFRFGWRSQVLQELLFHCFQSKKCSFPVSWKLMSRFKRRWRNPSSLYFPS